MDNVDLDRSEASIPPKQSTIKQIWRQYKTMLRKDFIVTLKHPFILLIVLLVPALLFLSICDNRFLTQEMTQSYKPMNLTLFDLTKKPIAYYPSGSPAMVGWIKALSTMYDTPPTSEQIVGFESETALKNFIVNKCPDCFWASFSFTEVDPALVSFTYTWRVSDHFLGDQETGKNSDRLYDPIIAENMAEYATALYLTQHPNVRVNKHHQIKKLVSQIQIRKFPDVPYYDYHGIYNKIGSGAPVVLALSCVLSFLAFTLNIVSDKQMKLRSSLHTVGLRDVSFWASLFTVAVVVSFAQALLINILMDISGFVYMKNSPVLLNLFILWLALLGAHTFSFLIGALLYSVKAFVFVFFIFLILFFVAGSFCTNHKSIYPEFGSPSGWYILWLSHAAQAMYLISQKAIPYIDMYFPSENSPFTWKDSYKFTGQCNDFSCDPNGYDCGHTVAFCICMLLIFIFVHLILAAYIDVITPAAHGSALKLWEPFTPEFWGFVKQAPPPPSHLPNYQQQPPLKEWDADVKMESYKILSPVNSAEFYTVQGSAILIYDLNVKFKPPCGKAIKHAVNSLSLALPRNTVLSLLGGNGAGKTTTLSVITGQLRATSGYVQVDGLSCGYQRRQVAQKLGYAPQFDILWADLSPAEHIRIFADLRGLEYYEEIQSIKNARFAAQRAGLAPLLDDEDELNDETVDNNEHYTLQKSLTKKQALNKLIDMRLSDVALEKSKYVASRSLSGGMRRRLTLCLALVGNPPILLLDEISTGLDPISKRKIWDVILRSKTDRSILLTTHSMEEADKLSDRLAIMAFGVLRCIGPSSRLKRKYGMGFRIDIQCEFDPIIGVSDVLKIRDELVNPYMKEALLIGRTGGHLTLAIPRSVDEYQLNDFLLKVEARKDIVKTWGIRQTTLEEVFLAISRHAEKVNKIQQILQ